MSSMEKTLKRIELYGKTDLKEVRNELKEVRVRVAALEINMNSMGKTLQRIELFGKTELLKEVNGSLETEFEGVNGSLETGREEGNGKLDAVTFWLIMASMVLSNLVGLGALGPLIAGLCLLSPTFGFRYMLQSTRIE
jgi:hypothetical protein